MGKRARPAAVSHAGEGAGCALLSCFTRDRLHPRWGLSRAFSLLLPCCRMPRLGCRSGRVWGIHVWADPQHHTCSHSQALRFVQSHVVPGTVPRRHLPTSFRPEAQITGLRRWKGQRDHCFKESWSDGGDSAAPPPAGPPPPSLMQEAWCILRQLPGSWDRRA